MPNQSVRWSYIGRTAKAELLTGIDGVSSRLVRRIVLRAG
jgi:hypothetical protein